MKSIGNLILRFLFGRIFKKTLETALKEEEEDFPEYQAALIDYQKNVKNLEKLQARMNKSVKALDKANAAKAKKSK